MSDLERPSNFYYLENINRTMCDVLQEMRLCNKTRNYASMNALIEELQIMGNRMESKLQIYKAINSSEEYRKELRKEIISLENIINSLKEKIEDGMAPNGKKD